MHERAKENHVQIVGPTRLAFWSGRGFRRVHPEKVGHLPHDRHQAMNRVGSTGMRACFRPLAGPMWHNPISYECYEWLAVVFRMNGFDVKLGRGEAIEGID